MTEKEAQSIVGPSYQRILALGLSCAIVDLLGKFELCLYRLDLCSFVGDR